MALKPESRYLSPRALAEDIERWLADEPVQAYREPFFRRARRFAGRHRTPLSIAATAATVAALLLGNFAWQRHDRRRTAETKSFVLLAEADRLAGEARAGGDPTAWIKAIAEVQRAVDQLESAGGNVAEAQARLKILQDDSRMVADLDEARIRGASVKDGGFDTSAKIDGYLIAFQNYGIDLKTLAVEEASNKIRTSRIADDLISAIDDWASYDRMDVPRNRLEAIAHTVDTDPIRISIRNAVVRHDAAALLRLCEKEEDRRKLGPRLRYIFNSLLRLDAAGSLPLLEAVRRESPDDFWLNHDLGMAYKNAQPPQPQEAVRCLSAATALRPDSPGVHLNLGLALETQGKFNDSIAEYRIVIRMNPEDPKVHSNLGNALKNQGKFADAIVEFRSAIRIDPELAEAHSNLGLALGSQGQIDDAIAEFRTAIRINSDLGEAHSNLGIALATLGKLDDAITEYRAAIRINPDDPKAHYNLGFALRNQDKIDDAITEFRTAIRINSEFAEAHSSLGIVLQTQGKLDDAVAEHLSAIRSNPKDARARYNLGIALKLQGKLAEAIAEFRSAIRINPEFPEAYYTLGSCLHAQRKLDDAITAYRAAIRINPESVDTHYNLGIILKAQGKLDDAITEYRAVIRINPEFAEARCNLGLILGQQGHFQESLESLERGHKIGSRRSNRRYPSAAWVRNARRLVTLEEKIPAFLDGEATPKNVEERLTLADMCYKKGLKAASARFYDEAFAEQPALADDLAKVYRYNAACAASQAGSGKDDPAPDEAARVKLRAKALDWLWADLTAWGKVFDAGNEPARKQAVAKTLAQWKEDPDLAGIRDEASLAKLPEGEREEFRSLWREVERLRKKASGG